MGTTVLRPDPALLLTTVAILVRGPCWHTRRTRDTIRRLPSWMTSKYHAKMVAGRMTVPPWWGSDPHVPSLVSVFAQALCTLHACAFGGYAHLFIRFFPAQQELYWCIRCLAVDPPLPHLCRPRSPVNFLPMRVSIFTPRANYFASQHALTFIKHVELASNYVILSERIIAHSQKPFYSVFSNCPIFFSCLSCRNQCRSLANGRDHSHLLHPCGCQETPIGLTRVPQQLSFAL